MIVVVVEVVKVLAKIKGPITVRLGHIGRQSNVVLNHFWGPSNSPKGNHQVIRSSY